MSSDTNRELRVPRCASADGPGSDVELSATPSRRQESRPRLRLQLPEGEEDGSSAISALDLEADRINNAARRTAGNREKPSTKISLKSPKLSFPQLSRPSIAKISSSKVYRGLKEVFPGLDLSWVTNNLDATRVKPALRGAVAAWVSLILLIIPRTERSMGQVSIFKFDFTSAS